MKRVNKLKLQLDWEIEAINDTISKVKVGFTEKGRSIYNRLTAPFIKTPFREKSINLIQDYWKWIDYQLNAVEHTNFFENRATEYAKASTQGNWQDIFK